MVVERDGYTARPISWRRISTAISLHVSAEEREGVANAFSQIIHYFVFSILSLFFPHSFGLHSPFQKHTSTHGIKQLPCA